MIGWLWTNVCQAANPPAPPAVSLAEQGVAWHSDVEDAWQTARKEGRMLLVFVTHARCRYCQHMKAGTYASPLVAPSLEADFVPLVLDGGSDVPLVRELAARVYPSTFVISPQAVVVDRIEGYVTPEVLARRLQAARSRTPAARLVSDP